MGFALALALSTQTADAREKANKGKQLERWSGRVQLIHTDAPEMDIRAGAVQRRVVWTPETKFTFRNKPDSIAHLKEGIRVICLGKYDGVRLRAVRVDMREK
jgi:hypothetical protein